MGNQFQMLYCPNWSDSIDIEFADFIEPDPLQSIIGTVGPFSDDCHPITHTSSDSTTCQPPAHVLLVLGLFLRLDNYAELFVTIDRPTAKRLLKLALDVSTTDKRSRPISYPLAYYSKFKPTSSQSKLAGSKKILKPVGPEASGHQQLALFPFVVLEKLFNLTSVEQVGLDKAVSVRNQALELGIVDVLLICLAHFAHQNRKTIKSLSNSTIAAAGQTEGGYGSSYAVPTATAATAGQAKNTAVSAPTSTNAAAAKSNAISGLKAQVLDREALNNSGM
uniref:Uncharacterized protein n=1 Tax=Ditylenchus dipsaci TaxID=166011 RepID=A0A915EUC8_9BILA